MKEPTEISLTPDPPKEPEILLNLTSLRYLKSIKNWALFFAILGFIGLGLMVLVGVVLLGVSSQFPKTKFPFEFFMIFYAVFAVVYFFPLLYLYRFSGKTESALKTFSAEKLEIGLFNLKRHFRFMGILTIIMLALYPIFIILMILFLPSNSGIPRSF